MPGKNYPHPLILFPSPFLAPQLCMKLINKIWKLFISPQFSWTRWARWSWWTESTRSSGSMKSVFSRSSIRSANTPYSCSDLVSSLSNKFSHITLVNKNFRERCTIDRDLQYTKTGSWISIDHMAIIEIKTDGRQITSTLARALREEHIRASGFSKYSMGRVLTDHGLMRNAFKKKLRHIENIHAMN